MTETALNTHDYLAPVGDSHGENDDNPGSFSVIPQESVSFKTLSTIFPDRDFNRFVFPLWVQLRDGWFRQPTSKTLTSPDPKETISALSCVLSTHFHRISPSQNVPEAEIQRLCRAFIDAGVYYDVNRGARPLPSPCLSA